MIFPEEFEKVPLLHDLEPGHLRKIAQIAQLREFSDNAIVFAEGESCYWVFIVLTGEVDLFFKSPSDQEVHIQLLSPGELLGWSPLLTRGRMTVTARAKSRCRLAALNVRDLLEQFESDSKFGMEFLFRIARALALRLNATRRKLLESPA